MSRKVERAAIYVRVSTDAQTVENQIRELKRVAGRRGWKVVEVYTDAGISGTKDRTQRPGLDRMLKDAGRRNFDVVMAWAIDRLGCCRKRARLRPRTLIPADVDRQEIRG
jgi:DNA invertase Pin-like site-specific DNA recombinase